MAQNDAVIAALIGSRICHDLISPIGAINNGIELLGMTGAVAGPEMELIAQSVSNASARIKYFRIAFGAASEQSIGAAEARSVLQETLGGGRLTIDYKISDGQPRGAVRLAFLGVLCLEAAMPYGGTIALEIDDATWTLTGEASKLNIDEALWSVLSAPGGSLDVAPSHVQFALLPILARDAARRLVTTMNETDISIQF